MIQAFGAERITVAIDVIQNPAFPSGYEVTVDGGNTATGVDAVEWSKRVDGFGVQVILPTSKSTDGMQTGFDLPLIEKMKQAVSAEIVASGGAGTMEHFLQAAQAGATILLGASVFHFNIIRIPELKAFLRENGIVL